MPTSFPPLIPPASLMYHVCMHMHTPCTTHTHTHTRADRRAMDEAARQLSDLDLLSKHAHIDSEEVVRRRKLESAAAAAAALSSATVFTAKSASAVDFDMATLDLDAYMAANTGASGGGGLFD